MRLLKFLLVVIVCSVLLQLQQSKLWAQVTESVKFFEPELALEDYEEDKLISGVDFYLNFFGAMSFMPVDDNFNRLLNQVNNNKNTRNSAITGSSNKYSLQRHNNSPVYSLGINLDVFFLEYFGVGFTYQKIGYQDDEVSIVSNKDTDTPDITKHLGYSSDAYGNSYHFSLLLRKEFGPRTDNNLSLILGLGYAIYDAELFLKHYDDYKNVFIEEKFKGSGHGFQTRIEFMLKISWFNFSFGYQLLTGTISGFGKSEVIAGYPKDINLLDIAPYLYFKIGLNF